MRLASQILLSLGLLALCWPAAARGAPGKAAAPAAIASRQKSFVIPFSVAPPPPGLKEVPQVDLYVSLDQGETWQIHGSAKANEKGFKFRAELDGEYCFAVRARQRGRPSASPKMQPELRVLIDTAAPELDLQARCDPNGVITAQLKVTEDHLLADSVKLEYRAADSVEAWEPVALDPIPADLPGPSFYGQPIWKPERRSNAYSIRAEVRDKAGNQAVAEAHVEFTPSAEEPAEEGPALQFDRQVDAGAPRADFVSDSRALDRSSATGGSSASGSPLDLPPVVDARRAVEPRPPVGPAPVAWPADEYDNLPNAAPREVHRPTGPVTRLPAVREPADSVVGWRPRAGQPDSNISPSVGAKIGGEYRGAEATPDWTPPGVHPRMVNATRFQLDYDVEAVGPWGIRRVELWGTRDYGRTWTQYGADEDNQSPLAAQVDEEGVYGFRVLVQSGSGLVEAPPAAGDVPEMWVRVDLTPPVCRITGVDHGSGERAGQLIIHWDASDALPAERPISLSFSQGPNGPWQPIASGLRNTGRYVWQLDQRTPDAVYLRLECRDEAGNVAVYQPTEPVTVVPLRPRARIREVRPFESGRQ